MINDPLKVIKTILFAIGIIIVLIIVLIGIICWAFNIPFTPKTILGFLAIITFLKLEVNLNYDREMFS